MRMFWTAEKLEHLLRLRKMHLNANQIAEKLTEDWGKPISRSQVLSAWSRAHERGDLSLSFADMVSAQTVVGMGDFVQMAEPKEDAHLDIVRAVQKGARTLESLCDKLNCSPSMIRRKVAAAKNAGYDLEVDETTIRFEKTKDAPTVQKVKSGPTKVEPLVLAFIADTHFGSAKSAAPQLKEFLQYAYDLGVRDVGHSGDIFDGCYHRGHHHELREVSFDRQCEAALNGLPQFDGLTYYTITGNHDYNSYHKTIGMDPGLALQYRAMAEGREDIHHLGHTQGNIEFGEGKQILRVQLVHPQKGGGTYAKSYPVQKWVETYEGGDKPHVAVMGHLHSYLTMEVRNVVAIQPGCWQWQSPFEQSKGLAPAVGGVIVWVYRDDEGFRFRHEWRRWWPKGAAWTKVKK